MSCLWRRCWININDVLSRVAFSGNVNISNATLQIDWGTYTPVAGGSFKLLSFVSCTGQFANVNIPPISGLAFTLTYNTTNIVISVTSALPIELSTFTATEIQSQKAQLNWKTATETNVKNFDIEKSADGRKFEKIGEVEANNTPSVYSAFDDYFFESAYYRLKINDLDGKVTYSTAISALTISWQFSF